MLTFLLVLPAILLALAVLLTPVWWPIAKTWLADHKLFYAALRERSAIARRRAGNTWMVYVQPGPQDLDHYKKLAKQYATGKMVQEEVENGEAGVGEVKNAEVVITEAMDGKAEVEEVASESPMRMKIVLSRDALVWIGVPFFKYERVAPWYLSADLKDAANDEKHTIPLKEQTTLFPKSLADDTERKRILDRVTEAKKTRQPLLADEVRKLMAMDPQNSAEGFEILFDLEADWQIVEPIKFILGHEFIGDLMVSLFNNAARLAMAGLRLVPVDTDNAQPVEETLTREFEHRTQMYLGIIPWDAEFAKAEGMIKLSDDRKADVILMSKGIKLLGVRIRDIELPKDVMELLKKPAAARAQGTADLTAADIRVKAADKDAQALRNKGKGERDYNILVAKGHKQAAKLEAAGDKDRIAAWDRTGPAAAARLEQISIDAWQKGVTSPGAGKVIITGAPGAGAQGNNLEGLAAKLATVVKEVSTETKELPPGDSKEVPPAKE